MVRAALLATLLSLSLLTGTAGVTLTGCSVAFDLQDGNYGQAAVDPLLSFGTLGVYEGLRLHDRLVERPKREAACAEYGIQCDR